MPRRLIPIDTATGENPAPGIPPNPSIPPNGAQPTLPNQPMSIGFPMNMLPQTHDSYVESPGCMFKVDDGAKIVKVWLYGTIRNTNPYRKLISMLHTIPADYKVHMYIHGPGGSINAGCNILTAMGRCKAQIITFNVGMAASCASLILSFGNLIHVDENSITMFHNSSSGSFDSSHRVLTKATHAIAYVNTLFEAMKAKGLVTEEEVEGIVKRGEEFYLNGEEMKSRLEAKGIWYGGEQ